MVISDGISDVCSTDLYVFFAYLAVALVPSNLTARIRAQAEAARVREARTAALYDFSRMVTGAASEDDILWAVVPYVASLAKAHSLVLMPEVDRMTIRAAYPPEIQIDDTARIAAACVCDRTTVVLGLSVAARVVLGVRRTTH